jgi:ribonuclease D
VHAGIRWIDTQEGLDALAAEIAGAPFALDTEADSFHHYHDKVCLVQVTAECGDVLIDPLHGVDLEPLRPSLEDATTRKILHGADYDVRILHRDFRFSPRGIFDTMIAARLTGATAFGLAALLEEHLDIRLDKAHQRADWSIRPLPVAMAEYAAADTRHLRDLAAILEARLVELGRLAWAKEEFERIEVVRWRNGEEPSPEAWRRTKGATSLDRRALAILRELWQWRDATARAKDRPPFKVLRDEALVAVSRKRPANRSELEKVEGIFPGFVRSSGATPLLEAVARGVAVPEADLPPPFEDRRVRPDPEFERRVGVLKARRDAVAKELGLEPGMVGGRSLLEAIQRRIDAGEDPAATPDLRTWQWNLIGPDA